MIATLPTSLTERFVELTGSHSVILTTHAGRTLVVALGGNQIKVHEMNGPRVCGEVGTIQESSALDSLEALTQAAGLRLRFAQTGEWGE